MTQQKAAYRGRVKYDENAARKYQIREPGKHNAEMRMVDRAFKSVPKTHRVLDCPCGGGRVTLHLGKQGYAMSAGDLSDPMIQITKENVEKAGLNVQVQKADIEKLDFTDRQFDTIISFRLFHHFPNPEIRQRAVTELCRVSRKYVALSYFSPASVTSVRNKVRAALGGKKSGKHSTPLSEVEGYFTKAGFKLVKDFAQLPLIHTMHLALFERTDERNP